MKALNARRVAWEAARVLVEASTAETYWWLSDMVSRYLGVMYQLKLAETRLRLTENDELTVAETRAWRARLDELLGDRPDLAPMLAGLTKETAARLP